MDVLISDGNHEYAFDSSKSLVASKTLCQPVTPEFTVFRPPPTFYRDRGVRYWDGDNAVQLSKAKWFSCTNISSPGLPTTRTSVSSGLTCGVITWLLRSGTMSEYRVHIGFLSFDDRTCYSIYLCSAMRGTKDYKGGY